MLTSVLGSGCHYHPDFVEDMENLVMCTRDTLFITLSITARNFALNS